MSLFPYITITMEKLYGLNLGMVHLGIQTTHLAT
jgi:hypothetical protein